jgi:hypothetical protein
VTVDGRAKSVIASEVGGDAMETEQWIEKFHRSWKEGDWEVWLECRKHAPEAKQKCDACDRMGNEVRKGTGGKALDECVAEMVRDVDGWRRWEVFQCRRKRPGAELDVERTQSAGLGAFKDALK